MKLQSAASGYTTDEWIDGSTGSWIKVKIVIQKCMGTELHLRSCMGAHLWQICMNFCQQKIVIQSYLCEILKHNLQIDGGKDANSLIVIEKSGSQQNCVSSLVKKIL